MVKIALAGGTGALGRTILDVLVQSASKHEVITLSRKSPELPTGHRSVQVDYDDVFGLRKHLEDNGIEVVIATFHMSMGALQAQLNLIEAASRSECTYRFIPTSFAIPYPYG
jgi:putative NADH-flavin reductase